jgi:hypothetical protein
MEDLLHALKGDESVRQALGIKKMLFAGMKHDAVLARAAYDELIPLCEDSPILKRIVRYDYAHALYQSGAVSHAITISEELAEEYFRVLGLTYADVLGANIPEILPKVSKKADLPDDFKRLADTLNLRAKSLDKLGFPSGFCRIHAFKFFAMAGAITSVIRVGMDFVDECIGIRSDPIGARQFMESALLPHLAESKLFGYLMPVNSLYAVVLAYCGQIGDARQIMRDLEPYADAWPDGSGG